MSKKFWHQPVVAVSGDFGGKVPIVDDVLSSQEQEFYPTTSLDENCIEFEFQTDRNYYVDLGQSFRSSNLSKDVATIHTRVRKKKKSTKMSLIFTETGTGDDKEEEKEEDEEEVARVIYVNNIMHSIFSNVEMYINNQQIYNSNGLYEHKSYISNNFKGAINEYKAVLHCQSFDYQKDPEDITNFLPDPFFTRRMKQLSRPDGFMLYDKLGIEFF